MLYDSSGAVATTCIMASDAPYVLWLHGVASTTLKLVIGVSQSEVLLKDTATALPIC